MRPAARPDRRPVLVRPSQTELEPRLPALQHFVERSLEQAPAGEPVVPVAERRDAMPLGERGLRVAGLGQPQVVEAELARQLRLFVARGTAVGPARRSSTP